MGIFNFFKKKAVEIKVEKKRIRVEELPTYIETEVISNEEKHKRLKEELEGIKKSMEESMKQAVKELKNYDLEKRKEEERIKLIVKKNLSNYIELSEELIKKLGEVNFEDINEGISKINITVRNTDKRALMSYQKANILVGKELAAVREVYSKGINELNKHLEENNRVIKEKELLEEAERLLEEKEKVRKEKERIKKVTIDEEGRIIKLTENKELLKKELEELINSEKHKNKELIIKKLIDKNKELEENIKGIRNHLNLKELANTYHHDERKLGIIKEYKESFMRKFKEEAGKDLKALVKDDKKVLWHYENIENIEKEIKKIIIPEDGVEEKERMIEENIKETNRTNNLVEEYHKELVKQEKLIKEKFEMIKKMLKESVIVEDN